MKIKTLIAVSGLALAATAQAGEEASAKQVIAPVPAGQAYVMVMVCWWICRLCLDGDDWDEDIYTLHIGKERKCAGDKCSQAIYLEVGFTESDFVEEETSGSEVSFTTTTSTEVEIIPITLNYKYECELSDKLNWYAGAGAGIALVDVDIETSVSGDNGGPTSESDDDTAFYGHIFAGLVYNVSDTIEVFGGARYIFMDDVLGGESLLDEEVHYELGARYNF